MNPNKSDIEPNESPRRNENEEEFVPGPLDPQSEADDSAEVFEDVDEDMENQERIEKNPDGIQ